MHVHLPTASFLDGAVKPFKEPAEAFFRSKVPVRDMDEVARVYEELDILESGQVIADSEGLRDPAEEFERKAGLDECYRRVITAIANLSLRQQQATAWHLLRDADDPLLLTELFNAFHIDIPEVDPEDKDEKHLLDASYTHAKKALARSLDIDLSQFKQTKRHPPMSSIPQAKVSER